MQKMVCIHPCPQNAPIRLMYENSAIDKAKRCVLRTQVNTDLYEEYCMTIPVPTITYTYVGCRGYTAICDPAGGDCRANPPGPAAVDQTSLKPFCVYSSYAIKRQILEVQDILDRL